MSLSLVSPVGLALASYIVFLGAWCFPPDLYTYYINEPDRMYLDWTLLTFYTCCVGGFLLGCALHRSIARRTEQLEPKELRGPCPSGYLCIPIILASLACIVFLLKLGAKIDFVAMLAARQGQEIKAAGLAGELVSGTWSSTGVFLTGILWWALYRSHQALMPLLDRLVFVTVFAIGVAVDLAVCIATVDRTSLMPLVAGLFIVYFFGKLSSASANLKQVLLIFGSGIVILASLFLGMSVLRGASASRFLITSLMGYSIVSYNRLSSLLSGTMVYAYGGLGTYLFPLAVRNERLNSIIPLRSHFGWPTGEAQFLSEFTSVLSSGLNSAYIWSGAFGYIYSDIGWWTILYLAAIGAMAHYLWTSFRGGNALGIISYLWVASSILFWIGGNVIFQEKLIRYCFIGIALNLYDRRLFRKPSPKFMPLYRHTSGAAL